VRAIVSWMPEVRSLRLSSLVSEDEGTVSRKCTKGCFLAFFGLMVLPRSAAAFFQVAFRVRRGTLVVDVSGKMFLGIVVHVL
jgi:hypothetical protein